MDKNIRIGRKELSDQDIVKHKDFGSLMNSYALISIPFYKTTWFKTTATVAAVAAVLCLLYFSVFQKPGNQNDPVTKNNNNLYADNLQKGIEVPLAGVAIQPQIFSLDASKGGVLIHKTGSSIRVPKNAFIDKSGEPVTGNVEIRYREFHNPVDFFVSGIPVHYDSAGQIYQMESAGMFELLAYQENVPVYLEKDKKIEVEMTSYFAGNYSTYFFDSMKNEWVNKGKDELVADVNYTPPVVVVPVVASDTVLIPVVPKRVRIKANVFNIQVDEMKFPELAGYEGIGFEVDESYNKIDKKHYNANGDLVCSAMVLEKSEVPGNYYLKISFGDSVITYIAHPAFKAKYYDEAMKVFNEKKQLHDAEMEKLKTQNLAQHNKKDGNSITNENRTALNYASLKAVGKRHISISGLGIYNCFIPVLASADLQIHPQYTDMAGSILKNAKIYYAERNHNILYAFGNTDQFTYREKTAILFWIVTQEGKIGVLSPGSFAILTKDNDNPVFRLNITEPTTGIEILKAYSEI
jgi:hypothetical protein